MTPASDPVLYRTTGEIARIELNRPDALNAVTPELVSGLIAAMERAIAENVGVAIVTGRGRAFCAGHDLKVSRAPRTELAHRKDLEAFNEVTRLVRRASFPIISAVHGYAIGNGCEFALAADLVVATESAEFGFPEVQWGLSVTGGISDYLVRTVGVHRAKELLFLGHRFTAAEGKALGLVTRVVPDDDLLDEAERLAAEILEQPRPALARAKRLVDSLGAQSLEWAMGLEVEHALLAAGRGRDQVSGNGTDPAVGGKASMAEGGSE